MIRESAHIVVERNTIWEGEAASEPYEVGWANEAILFVQVLEPLRHQKSQQVRVQLSPDGIHWCDEGTRFDLPQTTDVIAHARVTHFGGWLRLAVSLEKSLRARVLVSLHLKA